MYLGDCLEVMPMLLDQGEAMILDPPYGIAHKTRYGASWRSMQLAGGGDTEIRDTMVSRCELYAMPWACFGSWNVPTPPQARAVLAWDRGPAIGVGDPSLPWEPSWDEIAIGGRGWKGSRDEGVIRGHVVATPRTKGRCHPHEKPVSLIQYLLGKLPLRTICDPTMGIGTTGVACVRTSRRFLGVESDERYFAIAVRRVSSELSRAPLFERPIIQREFSH